MVVTLQLLHLVLAQSFPTKVTVGMASSIPKTQSNLLRYQNVSFLTSKALDVMMEMLNRSAVGAKISNYFSMMTGPGRAGEADGPEETHIIIIDNGRSVSWSGTFKMLRCIRCGACMNICPVYRHISEVTVMAPYIQVQWVLY